MQRQKLRLKGTFRALSSSNGPCPWGPIPRALQGAEVISPLARAKWDEDAKSKGGRQRDFKEVKERKWLPSSGTGWATGLTGAQKGLAAQGAAGVAREVSVCQLVPIDTLLPLLSILTLVLERQRALPLWGMEVGLRMPWVRRPTLNHRALGPGSPSQAAEGGGGLPSPSPSAW